MSLTDWSITSIGLRFQDVDANSDKWYMITKLENAQTDDYRVVFQWGKNGTTGQSSFKIVPSAHALMHIADTRANQKIRKGYEIVEPWSTGWVDPTNPDHMDVLQKAGINANGGANVTREISDGVTFEEMGTLVSDLLTKAVTADTDVVDVMVEAATVNAKFARLRDQFEDVKSQVEFVNTAVKSKV